MSDSRISHRIAIGISFLFLISPLTSLAGGITSPVTTFSAGLSQSNITFGHGGGWNNSTSITLPRNVTVTSANLTITPGAGFENNKYDSNASEIILNSTMCNLLLNDSKIVLGTNDSTWNIDRDADFVNCSKVNLTVGAGVRLNRLPDGIWTRVADGPFLGRDNQSAAWDRQNNQMVVFGGHSKSGINNWNYADTRFYNPSPNSWVVGTDDLLRDGGSAVWDSKDNGIILYGGGYWAVNIYYCRNDTYLYYPQNTTWIKKSDGPGARAGHSAVWDSTNNQMIVFGGYQNVGASIFYLNDTWIYSPQNDTWIQKNYGPVLSRCGHGAVWDPVGKQMIVYGGISAASYNETWAYYPQNDTWIQKNKGQMWGACSAVWDELSNNMIAFDGHGCWVYYPSNDTWSQQTASPQTRSGHSAVWDTNDNQMITCAGKYNTVFYNDTWTFSYRYQKNGTITAPIEDISRLISINEISWNASTLTNTSMNVSIRSSADNSSWSMWETVTNGSTSQNTPAQRYIQWRANLSTTDNRTTPVLKSVSIKYTVCNQTGVLISKPLTAPGNISRANMHLNSTLNSGAIAIRFSLDNGSSWVSTLPDTMVDFQSRSHYLTYSLQFNSSADGKSPLLDNITINYEYETLPTGIRLYFTDIMLPLGNLTAPTRIDITSILEISVQEAGAGTGDIVIPMFFRSNTAGSLNLTDLLVTFEPLVLNHPPVISDPLPADNSTVNSTDITLSWKANDSDGDNLSFEVFVNGISSASNFTGAQYIVHNLTPASSYNWRVKAFDGKEWAEGPLWHFSVTQAPNHLPTISTPSPADGATLTSTDVALSWTAQDLDNDSLSFKVFLNGSLAKDGLNITNYALHNLTVGVTYSWNVQAFDGKGWITCPCGAKLMICPWLTPPYHEFNSLRGNGLTR